MTVSYTKTPVGDKLFVVAWDINVNNNDEDGQAFECIDCELLSISSTVAEITGDVVPKMYFSNFEAPNWYGWKISLEGSESTIMIPGDADLPAPTRYVFPRLEGDGGGEGSLRVVAFFREL